MKMVKELRALTMLAMLVGSVLAIIAGSSTAMAYDQDTHFYEFYLMARYAGINHEVSLKMATYNEYIDENYWTTPMDPIPYSGATKRALFHFPVAQMDHATSKQHESVVGHLLGKMIDHAQENSPIGNELIAESLKRGDFILFGAGFHVLMDTFGHSTHVPALGHLPHGHFPDNTAFNFDKHQRMVDTVLRALAVVRQALPDSAIDKTFADGGGKPHYLLSGEELSAKYRADNSITAVITKKSTLDPRFTRFAVEFLLKKAKDDGVIRDGFDISKVVNDPRLTAGAITADALLMEFYSEAAALPDTERDATIDFGAVTQMIMRDYGVSTTTFAQLNDIQKENFKKEFARRMIVHEIPLELNSENLTTYQVNGPIRDAELMMRISDRQDLIFEKTGRMIALSKKVVDELSKQIAKDIVQGKEDGTYQDIARELSQADNLATASANFSTMTKKEKRKWAVLFGKYLYVDTLFIGLINRGLRIAHLTNPKKPKFEGRNVPSWLAFQYTRDEIFKELKGTGYIKNLLTDNEVARLQEEVKTQNSEIDQYRPQIEEMKATLLSRHEGTAFGDLLKMTIYRPYCQDLFR